MRESFKNQILFGDNLCNEDASLFTCLIICVQEEIQGDLECGFDCFHPLHSSLPIHCTGFSLPYI